MRALGVHACVAWLVVAGCSDDALEARKQQEAAREAAIAEETLARQSQADLEAELEAAEAELDALMGRLLSVATDAERDELRAPIEAKRADVERLRKQLGKQPEPRRVRIHHDCSGPNADPLMCDL